MEAVNVSVIVPVYNVQDYLAKCVDSVLSQTYEDFELILVNDGSKDSSPEICDGYLQKDARIKVIHKENGGLSSARNAGLDVAKGKYIYFLDSDDYIEPDLLETTISIMEREQCDMVSFGEVKEDVHGNHIENILYKPANIKIATEEERMDFQLKHQLNCRMGWEAWNRIFRGDIIREHGLRFVSERKVFAEDLLFSFTYWLYAKSCVTLPTYYHHYVQRGDSLMSLSKTRNVLPQARDLAMEAYNAVVRANLPLLQKDFAMIYMHILEWQIRPYVAEKGVAWVKDELSKIQYQQFWPKEKAQQRQLYQDLMTRYGDKNGVVTVVLPVQAKEELPRIELYIEKLLTQTLQKLDILVLSREELQLNAQDIRVRVEQVESLDPEKVVAFSLEEGYGESVYFADYNVELPVRFMEDMGNALKYHDCGTVILTEEQPMFVDKNSVYDRRKFRKFIRDHKIPSHRVMLRRDLLEESGLGCLGDLNRYMSDILLSNHIVLMK